MNMGHEPEHGERRRQPPLSRRVEHSFIFELDEDLASVCRQVICLGREIVSFARQLLTDNDAAQVVREATADLKEQSAHLADAVGDVE